MKITITGLKSYRYEEKTGRLAQVVRHLNKFLYRRFRIRWFVGHSLGWDKIEIPYPNNGSAMTVYSND